jgi:hypothetical protein
MAADGDFGLLWVMIMGACHSRPASIMMVLSNSYIPNYHVIGSGRVNIE